MSTSPDDPASAKAACRRTARARRAALGSDDRGTWSAAVAERLRSALPASGPVMTYVAMGDELDLAGLNADLAAAGRLVLPRVEGRRLAAVPWRPGDELAASSFGVLEPTGEPIDPTDLVVVVVPGLAFDRQGRRVGYGAGFYDRFLVGLSRDCRTIGVCFAAQLFDEIPAEPHDIAVHDVVAEPTGS